MRFYRSVLNMLYNSRLPYILKDEGCFWKSFGVGILSRDYPIFQGVPFHVEVDADFHHGQAAQGEAFGIVSLPSEASAQSRMNSLNMSSVHIGTP